MLKVCTDTVRDQKYFTYSQIPAQMIPLFNHDLLGHSIGLQGTKNYEAVLAQLYESVGDYSSS